MRQAQTLLASTSCFFLHMIFPACLLLYSVPSFALDLGGPCGPINEGPAVMRGRPEYKAAEKAGDWEMVLRLDKLEVRRDCRFAQSWIRMARSLVKLKRYSEASEAIKKGFEIDNDLTPEDLKLFPIVSEFLSSHEFELTEFGKEYHSLKAQNEALNSEFKTKLAHIPKDQRPPETFVHKETSVYKCLSGSEWTLKKDAELLNMPDRSHGIGKLLQNEKVKLVSVEEHIKPRPVGVVFDSDSFKKGDVFYYITRVTESNDIYWRNGQEHDEDLPFYKIKAFCLRPRPRCAAQFVEPNPPNGDVSWYKVRTKDGKEGWVESVALQEPEGGCD